PRAPSRTARREGAPSADGANTRGRIRLLRYHHPGTGAVGGANVQLNARAPAVGVFVVEGVLRVGGGKAAVARADARKDAQARCVRRENDAGPWRPRGFPGLVRATVMRSIEIERQRVAADAVEPFRERR